MSSYNPDFFEASRPSEKLLKHLSHELSDESPELLNDIKSEIYPSDQSGKSADFDEKGWLA